MRLNACKVYCAVMDTTSHDNRGPWTRNMILFFTLKKSITLRPPLSVCHFCRSVRLFLLGERLERAVTPRSALGAALQLALPAKSLTLCLLRERRRLHCLPTLRRCLLYVSTLGVCSEKKTHKTTKSEEVSQRNNVG